MASSELRSLLVAAVLVAPGAAQVPGGFEALLWRYGGPPMGPELASALKVLGVTGVVVDQDEDPAPVAALGLRFYLDHAAGKGILHLREPEFRQKLEAYERSRDATALVRPQPLLDGRVRGRLLELVEARVRRAAPLGPLLVSLDDEISVTRFVNPLDFCHDATTLAAFRDWLQARYGTIDALNAAWKSRFADFAAVVPPTTDAVRRREMDVAWPERLCDWNDHREFMDQVLAGTVGWLCERSRALAPGVPVGFEGGQPPAAFGGFDWARLLEVVDFVEPYDVGGTRELVRSLKRPGTRHYETVFPDEAVGPASRAVAHLYDALAHGLSGTILWSADALFVERDAARVSGYGSQLGRELPRVTSEAAGSCAGAEVFAGEIAILESQASVRLHWMLDSSGDGATWTRRFGSHEQAHSTSQAARQSWVRLFQDLGYAFRFVTPRDVERGLRARLLVLPSALALSDATVFAIRAFVDQGGVVIADETPARYDDRLRLRPLPALDGLFGVERLASERFLVEGRLRRGAPRLASGLGLVEAGLRAEGLTVAAEQARAQLAGRERPPGASEQSGAESLWFERASGRGRAVLFNLAIAEYGGLRLTEDGHAACRDLRQRLARLLQRLDLQETVVVSVRGYPTILERVLLARGGKKVLVVRANCLESASLFQTLAARGPQPMTLMLPVAARLRDLWSGKTLGEGRRIEAELDPVRGSFFLVESL